MDISTVGQSLEDFMKRCLKCNKKYGDSLFGVRSSVIYSKCDHIVCDMCFYTSRTRCVLCQRSDQTAKRISIDTLICVKCPNGFRILSKENMENVNLEKTLHENIVKELETVNETVKAFENEKKQLENRIKDMELMQSSTLKSLSKEREQKNDAELALKRDVVVTCNTMSTVARLLQSAREEVTKLSEEVVNAVTLEEFDSTWSAADKEVSRARDITGILLDGANDAEKSLEKVVTELGAIRTRCKVTVKNSGKRKTSEDADDEPGAANFYKMRKKEPEFEAATESAKNSVENANS